MLKTYLLLVIVLCCAMSCIHKSETEKKSACSNQDLNPNGDSELAILMRKLTKQVEQNAALIRDGKPTQNYREFTQSILTAKPTDSKLDRKAFEPHAQAFLHAVQQFNDADFADKINYHNAIITSCRSCHEQFCRGPLKRIDRMKVIN